MKNIELLEIINEFTVSNINTSIKFYTTYFDFNIIDTYGKPINWAKLKKDNCTIMLETYNEVKKEIDNYPKKVSSSNLIKFKYKNKEQVLNLYNNLLKDNMRIFMNLKETEYASVEFGAYDPDNNMIIVSCDN